MMIHNSLIWIFIIETALSLENEGFQTNILEETNSNDGSGNYHFSFKTSDGLTRNEVGKLINGESGQKRIVQGTYSYTDPNGKEVVVQYTSDENGYSTVNTTTAVEVSTKAATESPTEPKIPSVTISQKQVPPFTWYHRPGIIPLVVFRQPEIPPFVLVYPPAQPSTLPFRQPIVSAEQTQHLETSSVPLDPNKIPYHVPYRPDQIPTAKPDSKPGIIPPASYSSDEIIDVQTRLPGGGQQVVSQPILISLLGGGGVG